MKKFRIFLNTAWTVWLLAGILLLNGCGKKEDEGLSAIEDNSYSENLAEITEETAKAEEPAGTDMSMEAGDVIKLNFEGTDSDELNGKIQSMIPADTDRIVAITTEGKLFLLMPYIEYYIPKDSEIKSYGIADGCKMDDLTYANQHIAYGQNNFVHFEMIEGYEDEDVSMLDAGEFPDITYTAENVKQVELSGNQNLLLVNDEADFIAYTDGNGHACVYHGDTVYSDVEFTVDENVRENTAVRKGIYRFVLTEEQELLYISNMSTSEDFGGTVKGISLDCQNLTEEIGAKIADIYNCQNYEDSCYAVDEDNNIYYVENSFIEDKVTAEKITLFENGKITDVQRFSGQHEDILIRTEDGSYYYSDSSHGSIQKIESLDQTYKNAVLLMDGNVLGLGKDGCLYLVISE